MAAESPQNASHGSGLMDSFARFGQSLISALQTRLQLVADELEEQGTLLAEMALLWAFAGLCLVLAGFVAAVLLVVVYWESRVAVLASMLAVLATAACIAVLKAKAIGRARPRAFTATLSELSGDRSALDGHRPSGGPE